MDKGSRAQIDGSNISVRHAASWTGSIRHSGPHNRAQPGIETAADERLNLSVLESFIGAFREPEIVACCLTHVLLPNVEIMASSGNMTIQIPDDLARGLEGIAVRQRKSVEQIALENLRLLLDQASSPEAVLRSVRSLPHPSEAAVDDLEAAVASARLPVSEKGTYDERHRG